MSPTELRQKLEAAFAHVAVPAADAILAHPLRDDAGARALKVLVGKPWMDARRNDLFPERDALYTLTRVAFRAYLPAYLMAGLVDDRGPSMRGALTDRLIVWPHQKSLPPELTEERLSSLDHDQRVVLIEVLRDYHLRFYEKDAAEVLRRWVVTQ